MHRHDRPVIILAVLIQLTIGVVTIALAFGWLPAGYRSAKPAYAYDLHFVSQGESLWMIAQRYYPDLSDQELMEMAQRIAVYNRIENGVVYPSQVIRIPKAEGKSAAS